MRANQPGSLPIAWPASSNYVALVAQTTAMHNAWFVNTEPIFGTAKCKTEHQNP